LRCRSEATPGAGRRLHGGRHRTFDPPARCVYPGPVKPAVWALLPILLGSGGCTVVLSPGEQQCETAKDCEARGFSGAECKAGVCEKVEEIDPIWGCVGNVVEPKP